MHVEIIDLGLNNIASVAKSFSGLSNDIKVSIRDSYVNSEYELPNLIVLPGLGKFGTATRILDDSGLRSYLEIQNSNSVTIVGICLGMQLFGNSSEESPEATGLNFIEARTKKLLGAEAGVRIPNVGWNGLQILRESPFSTLSSDKDFYFVHSFHMQVDKIESVLTTTDIGSEKFVSTVFQDNIIGFQFHPEKSGLAGRDLLKEVLNYALEK